MDAGSNRVCGGSPMSQPSTPAQTDQASEPAFETVGLAEATDQPNPSRCLVGGCDSDVLHTRTANGKMVNRKMCRKHYGEQVSINYANKHGYIRTEGSRRVSPSGYAFIFTNGRWVSEHRYIMEQRIGRPLHRGESVHHINGNRSDNRDENLELWVGPIMCGQRAGDLRCPHCSRYYIEEYNDSDSYRQYTLKDVVSNHRSKADIYKVVNASVSDTLDIVDAIIGAAKRIKKYNGAYDAIDNANTIIMLGERLRKEST